MRQIEAGHYIMDKWTDLTYSPNDSGWYFTDFKHDRVSVTYHTKAEAMTAYYAEAITWE